MPSRYLLDYSNTELYQLFQHNLTANSDAVKYSVFSYKDVSITDELCLNWNNFLSSGVNDLPFENVVISKMAYSAGMQDLTTGRRQYMHATCNDLNIVNFMVGKINSGKLNCFF